MSREVDALIAQHVMKLEDLRGRSKTVYTARALATLKAAGVDLDV